MLKSKTLVASLIFAIAAAPNFADIGTNNKVLWQTKIKLTETDLPTGCSWQGDGTNNVTYLDPDNILGMLHYDCEPTANAALETVRDILVVFDSTTGKEKGRRLLIGIPRGPSSQNQVAPLHDGTALIRVNSTLLLVNTELKELLRRTVSATSADV